MQVSNADIYTAIVSVLDDLCIDVVVQMRAHLVEQNNCYLVAQGTRVVNELLGLQSISDMPAKIVPFFEAAEQRSTDSEEYETLLSLDDRNKRRRIK